ncbi:MAG TPA: sensor domain-containing diguanylate cyclase [Capillibacterium sp.]
MSLQNKEGNIRIRLRNNLRLHSLTIAIFLLLVWGRSSFGNGAHLQASSTYIWFTLGFSLGCLVVKLYLYRRKAETLQRCFWLVDLLDVAAVSFLYYLGFYPVNFLLVFYFLLIFFTLRQAAPSETYYVTFLSLLGLGINAVLLWPNLPPLAQLAGRDALLSGLSLLTVMAGLGLMGYFTNLYAQSDLHLANHLQQMLDEKEAVLKEASLTHAKLEEKYAFAYTLTLIQQSLLEESDEANLLSRITDIIQGVLGSYSCAIFSIEQDNSLKLSAYSGPELPPELDEIVKQENSLVAQTIATQAIKTEEAATPAERHFWAEQGINSLLAIPLSTKNDKLGVVLTTGAQGFSFNQEQQEQLMIIINQVSLALENTRLLKKTKLMAWHDPLTGLYNRNYLNMFLSVVEGNPENNLGCLLFDLDHFKVINDTYGHSTGDVVLKEVSTILAKYTSPRRIAVRYGGEEFMLLSLNSEADELFTLAETIRKETAALNFSTNKEEHFSITISGGIAVGRGDFNVIFIQADTALYEAKNTGRNKVVIYQPN